MLEKLKEQIQSLSLKEKEQLSVFLRNQIQMDKNGLFGQKVAFNHVESIEEKYADEINFDHGTFDFVEYNVHTDTGSFPLQTVVESETGGVFFGSGTMYLPHMSGTQGRLVVDALMGFLQKSGINVEAEEVNNINLTFGQKFEEI